MLFRTVLRHRQYLQQKVSRCSNVVSKPDNSQPQRALTLGLRCLDEQPLQQSAVLCHTQRFRLFYEW
jgi:hypothetical protein